MYSELEARQKVLDFVNSGSAEREDEFVVSSIHLSEHSDYWIVTANSRAYVEEGDISRCYVGVSAYMLNTESGEIEIIGSAQSPQIFLQDKYDLRRAGSQSYVLVCSHDKYDKRAIINFHQVFKCPLQKAIKLIRERRDWFTGKKRFLVEAQNLLAQKGIKTIVELKSQTLATSTIKSEIIWWEAMEKIVADNLLVE